MKNKAQNKENKDKKEIKELKHDKISFKAIEAEINNSILFWGTLACLGKLREYKENPEAENMTLKEFKKALDDFKKAKSYKNTGKEE